MFSGHYHVDPVEIFFQQNIEHSTHALAQEICLLLTGIHDGKLSQRDHKLNY